jgi:excisionase family DNA binding protein
MSTVADPPCLYTIQQAAALLKLKPYRLSHMIRTGEIVATRTGGTPESPRGYRFTAEQIQAYIASRPTTAPAEGGAA